MHKSIIVGSSVVLTALFCMSSLAQAPVNPSAMSKNDIIDAIRIAAKESEVNPALALAVAEVESGFNPDAKRYEPKFKTWSMGLFQIFVPTARTLGFKGDVKELLRPMQNIELGIRHLQSCTERFKTNVAKIACCHNAGVAVVESVCRNNEGVKDYVGKVLSAYHSWHSQPLVIAVNSI